MANLENEMRETVETLAEFVPLSSEQLRTFSRPGFATHSVDLNYAIEQVEKVLAELKSYERRFDQVFKLRWPSAQQ